MGIIAATNDLWVTGPSEYETSGGTRHDEVEYRTRSYDLEPLSVHLRTATAIPIVAWKQDGDKLTPVVLVDGGTQVHALDVMERITMATTANAARTRGLRQFRPEWQDAIRDRLLSEREVA